MTSIFITYNKKKFYLAHIYEQFLANEFRASGQILAEAKIGNEIISLRTKRSITKEKLLKILKDYLLTKSYYSFLVKTIQKETLNNLKNKAAQECFQLGVKNIAQLKNKLENYPNQDEFEKFAKNILRSDGITLVDENTGQYLIKGKLNKKEKCGKLVSFVRNKQKIEVALSTNAKNIVDGLVFDCFSKTIDLDNYLWLADRKKLVITFRLKNKAEINKLKTILSSSALKVGGLVYRSKRNEVIEKIWQELDWGKFIDLKKIKKELANIKTVKVLFKEKKININY